MGVKWGNISSRDKDCGQVLCSEIGFIVSESLEATSCVMEGCIGPGCIHGKVCVVLVRRHTERIVGLGYSKCRS